MHRKKSRVNVSRLATQLCKAVSDEDPRAVQALLSQAANPNLVGGQGVAAVHLAVGKETEKSTRCLKLLLQHGADPNVRSADGLTALHVAALWGCLQNLKLLLKNGGNPNLRDQEGNRAGDLAQQQDNRKCALILQDFQTSSLHTEDQDVPHFHYSVYTDDADTSSFAASETDDDASRHSSLLSWSDFGDAPLSSTRRSSLLDASVAAGNRLSWRAWPAHNSRPSDVVNGDGGRHSQTWGVDSDAVLSSTRMSLAAGSKFPLAVLEEDLALLTDCSEIRTHHQDVVDPLRTGDGKNAFCPPPPSPPPADDAALPPPCPSSRRHSASRKSVSFRDADEYFPVFGEERGEEEEERPVALVTSPWSELHTLDLSQSHTLDLSQSSQYSQYSGFLDSERMATVLHRQGIDVTSPDHVFVFSRDAYCAAEDEDMDKTVVGHFPALEEDDEEREMEAGDVVVEREANANAGGERGSASVAGGDGSTGSSSGTSRYSSCDSDPDRFVSALDASLHPRQAPPSEDGEGPITGGQAEEKPRPPMVANADVIADIITLGLTPGSTGTLKHSVSSEEATVVEEEELPAILDQLMISRRENPSGGGRRVRGEEAGTRPDAALEEGEGGGVFTPRLEGGREVFTPRLEGGREVFTPRLEGGREVFTPRLEGGREVFTPRLEGGREVFTPRLEGECDVFTPRPEVEGEVFFTPSPFVTGRTRSRLSRCSVRAANASIDGSLSAPLSVSLSVSLSSSSLFEQTLPTPTRTHRRDAAKSHSGSDNVFSDTPDRWRPPSTLSGSPSPLNETREEAGWSVLRGEGGSSSVSASQADTLILRGEGSSVSASQADTLILRAGSSSVSASQADTLILRGEGSSVSASQADTLILRGGSSSVSASQADTLILPCSGQSDPLVLSGGAGNSVINHQTLPDTVILERSEEEDDDDVTSTTTGSFDDGQVGMATRRAACEFLTDDLSSLCDTAAEGVESSGTGGRPRAAAKDTVSQPESPSSAATTSLSASQSTSSETSSGTSSSGTSSSSSSDTSSSSYFSPSRRGRDDPPDPSSVTPVTGCTPRYSMSRLSGLHPLRRGRSLAGLSYTPGGRPLLDPDPAGGPAAFLYTDTERGHELIETHVPPDAQTTETDTSSLGGEGSEDTVLYDWRSMGQGGEPGKENRQPEEEEEEEEDEEEEVWSGTRGLTDRELRRRLLELGESPGPISSRTRPVYMQRLRRLMVEPGRSRAKEPMEPRSRHREADRNQTVTSGHSLELDRALRTLDLPDCHADELELSEQFDRPDQNRRWREGVIKSSFNYLLLDPRVTKNLPFRSRSMTSSDCFSTFIKAIFYVGKGKRSRPYSHLYEALEYHRGDKTNKRLCSKVQHILEVWGAGGGVVSLHCFQNVIPVEAFTREACMVDAIGLKMLTNQKRGDYYGVVSTWAMKRKRDLGVLLLHRAMTIFLAEGERQLRPADIRAGQ